MSLSNDLISQFVKITKDKQDVKKETVVYGTVHKDANGNDNLVTIDGSNISTPVSKTVVASEGDRVTVMIKNHTATVTGNLSNPSARAVDTVDISNLNVSNAKIGQLEADNVTINNRLVAHEGYIAELEADNVRIRDRLTVNEADINYLKALDIDAETLKTAQAFVDNLEATGANINDLVANVAKIDGLIFGSASGEVVSTSFSNTVIAQLGDAQIKSAMIDNISASKITTGYINTNLVNIQSGINSKLLINGETIQIKDNSGVNRVQIGRDAYDDYSINIWDQNGNLMFSKGGITDAAIKEAIIRNDMVSDTANIHASKLNIDSLFEAVNNGTNTIKSAKIYLDDEKQTLDIAFKTLMTITNNQDLTIKSQGTAISTIQGQISSKIWQQDIDTVKNNMSTQYSTLEQSLNSFKTTVGNSYATRTELSYIDTDISNLDARISSNESSITQLNNSITSNVTETTNLGTRISTVEQTSSGLTTRLDNQLIGGTNILRCTNSVNALASSSNWANGTWRTAGGGTGERTVINVTDAPNADIKKGFRIIGNDTDTTTCQDNVPVTDGVQYTISCYARGTGTLRLQVGRSPYSVATYALNNVTNWTKYSLTFTAGDGNGISDGKTNVYFGNRGTGTLEICGFKMEFGNVSTDWTPSPYDYNSGIEAASQTATDYLSFSTTGLVIGDLTSSTLGKNVLIDSDSVDIRNGSTTLASFGANNLYLAKNSRNAKIDLCNGLATLYHQSKYSYDTLFIIDTPNATEIQGTYNPLCVTSTVSGKVSIQFANSSGVIGSIGMVESGTESYITRNHPSTAATYSILDTGNYYKLMDSGWVNCTLNTGTFTRYNNDIPQPQVRKIGKQVYLRGEAKPVTSVTPENDSGTYIATIPSGYRPSERQQFIMQGSGSYRWMMSIHTDGKIAISRYSNGTTANMQIASGSWLCCHAQWLID